MGCTQARRRCQMACKPGSVHAPVGAMDDHSSRAHVTTRLVRHTRAATRKRAWRLPSSPPLFGLAPGGVYHAAPVARGAVRSYRTLSPLPLIQRIARVWGGLLSVALSLGSLPPGVTRHRVSVEPGLSSLLSQERTAVIRPSDGGILSGNQETVKDWLTGPRLPRFGPIFRG